LAPTLDAPVRIIIVLQRSWRPAESLQTVTRSA
jgi:hypothetical protein